VIHEIAHGSVALYLGDPTAKNEGRLSLNPLRHIDFFGTILLPLLLLVATMGRGPIFGWAKPVPVNPFNFRDQKWGTLKASIAGPSMNFFIALIFSLAVRFVPLPQNFLIFFSIIAVYNFAWGLFNLVPIPPLDGSHILFTFLSDRFSGFKTFLRQYSIFILIFFLFFGLNWIYLGATLLYALISGRSLTL
jgi:Zn-dependent protease